jgi:hypothetical protein
LFFLSVLAVDRRPKGGPSVLEDRRNDQKLWLILFQIKGIRARLNSLAIQHWLFGTLAVLICAAALIFLSAVSLGPLAFLFAGAFFVAASIIAVVHVARSSFKMRASHEKAAALADERAQLKGRLMTVLTKADASKPSALWLQARVRGAANRAPLDVARDLRIFGRVPSRRIDRRIRVNQPRAPRRRGGDGIRRNYCRYQQFGNTAG